MLCSLDICHNHSSGVNILSGPFFIFKQAEILIKFDFVGAPMVSEKESEKVSL